MWIISVWSVKYRGIDRFPARPDGAGSGIRPVHQERGVPMDDVPGEISKWGLL